MFSWKAHTKIFLAIYSKIITKSRLFIKNISYCVYVFPNKLPKNKDYDICFKLYL